jgi:archaellum component FlaG (FlaF/FlaG flagellin family)
VKNKKLTIALLLIGALLLAVSAWAVIAVSTTKLGTVIQDNGVRESHARLAVTGLVADSDNTVPHGLPRTPRAISIRARASGNVWEKADPDATNIYLHVEAAGPTSVVLDVWY